MRKFIYASLTVAAMFGALVATTGCKSASKHEHSEGHVHQYTCPHHPEVVQSTAGNCAKCGMKLVHKE